MGRGHDADPVSRPSPIEIKSLTPMCLSIYSEQLPLEIDQVVAFASATKPGNLIEHRKI